MKKLLFLITLCITTSSFSQIKVGNSVLGINTNENFGGRLHISDNGLIISINGIDLVQATSLPSVVRTYEFINNDWVKFGTDFEDDNTGQQGTSVSLSSNGNILAMGTRNFATNTNGKVSVYQREGTSWTQIGTNIFGDNSGDLLGMCVSLSNNGNILVAGASGNSYLKVYENISGNWEQKGQTISRFLSNDSFGFRVSISGDGTVIAINSPYADEGSILSVGKIVVYKFFNNTWSQVGDDITGDINQNLSGYEIDLSEDGETLVIGSPYVNQPDDNEGQVKVYTLISDEWVQVGQTLYGENNGDLFGQSVSYSDSENVLGVGIPGSDSNGFNTGEVNLYKLVNNSWVEISTNLVGENIGDLFGQTISLSDNSNYLMVSSPQYDITTDVQTQNGKVDVFNINSVLSIFDSSITTTSIYPNPTKEEFTIQLQEGIQLKKVRIYNQLGQFISSTNTKSINVENLSQGIYFVEITTDKGRSTKKLIIN